FAECGNLLSNEGAFRDDTELPCSGGSRLSSRGFRSIQSVRQGTRAAMAIIVKIFLVVMFFVNTVYLAQAQSRRTMSNVEDQPGYVPSAAEERLDMAFQRQPVYFRTTEPPGTIIVHTSE